MPRKSTLFSVVGETQVMEYTGKRKVKNERMYTIGIEDLVLHTVGKERLIRVRTKSNGSKSHGIRTAKVRWKSL